MAATELLGEMIDPFARAARVRVPCGNCPWRKEGAIELMPGRLRSIATGLLEDNGSVFYCHKLLSGEQRDDEGEGDDAASSCYVPGANDAMCAGAVAFLLKAGRPPVMLRVAFALGAAKPSDYDEAKAMVLDPSDVLPDVD